VLSGPNRRRGGNRRSTTTSVRARHTHRLATSVRAHHPRSRVSPFVLGAALAAADSTSREYSAQVVQRAMALRVNIQLVMKTFMSERCSRGAWQLVLHGRRGRAAASSTEGDSFEEFRPDVSRELDAALHRRWRHRDRRREDAYEFWERRSRRPHHQQGRAAGRSLERHAEAQPDLLHLNNFARTGRRRRCVRPRDRPGWRRWPTSTSSTCPRRMRPARPRTTTSCSTSRQVTASRTRARVLPGERPHSRESSSTPARSATPAGHSRRHGHELVTRSASATSTPPRGRHLLRGQQVAPLTPYDSASIMHYRSATVRRTISTGRRRTRRAPPRFTALRWRRHNPSSATDRHAKSETRAHPRAERDQDLRRYT